MEFESKKTIENLENQIQKGYSLPIFKGYIAINKRGVEKLISTIYSSLPTDVIKARKYIESKGFEPRMIEKDCRKKLYKYLSELESQVNSTYQFATFIVVKIKEIENIIDKIYENLPEELSEAEKLSKD